MLATRSIQVCKYGRVFMQRRFLKSTAGLCTQNPAKRQQWSYLQGRSDTPLLGKTIGQLMLEQAEKHPDNEAFVFPHQNIRISFQDLLEQCDKLAAGFLALGIKKGDRVGMWGPNLAEWAITQFATARAGIILVNINPAYQVQELEYTLKKVGCKAVVAAERFKTQNYYEMLFDINHELAFSKPGELHSNRLPDLKHVIMLGEDDYPGTFRFQDVMEMGNKELRSEIENMQSDLQFDDAINIQFTSGTTGNPKGATLSHHNIVNNCYFGGKILEYDTKPASICVPVPLYHCFGMVLGCLSSVVHGSKVVFPAAGVEPGASLAAIQQEKCNSLYGTPTMFIDMLAHPSFDSFDLTSLNTGIMAGSPCPVEVMKQVVTRMHMKEVTIAYGTTENSPVTFMGFKDDPTDKKVSTIGHPYAHVETKVIDSNGKIVPRGQAGELCTRGYTTMLGYWEDKAKTDECIEPDGWYHTGDLAVLDEDGYGAIVGRIKDVVIRGGENIYPVEIEQYLYKHPSVEDVQVIGVPDDRMGEELCAYIRLKTGQEVTGEEIKAFCKGKMSHFKIPKYVLFIDAYPLTVTGKVQKFKLRKQALDDLELHHVMPHIERKQGMVDEI
ncbi:medium-chain acyl-CoA ligase ACSF2, mitochondrial-like [Lineus longissimus]|uniref:medium-chain acyl-CoA ligase ACSF2, mitochondrial-like n=1 Tax=Lineus longissimus TaxID=88925 RepID=UPI002B4FA794